MPVVFMGGGAAIMKNFAKTHEYVAYIDNIHANARAFEQIASRRRLKMPKQRFNFAFNLESPEHLRAYAEFVSWSPRKRGEYIIQAILRRIDTAN